MHYFFSPGVGAQGGNLKQVCDNAMHNSCGLLINMSRSILYANNGKEFYKYSREVCLATQLEMEVILREKKII